MLAGGLPGVFYFSKVLSRTTLTLMVFSIACRKKRMACSSEKPTCAQCKRSRSDAPCVYAQIPAKSTIAALSSRIKHLEREIGLLEAVQSDSPDVGAQRESSVVSNSLHHAAMNLNFTEVIHRPRLREPPSTWYGGEPPGQLKQRL